ncbi:hypothetical protein OBBRIDRAFT_847636 [Obba rivulosa]|uniref:Hydrophobin n=1 Tax=Obba rivulosa TaxID=1052685 RepID=A0A8E2DMG4_9APHY|nr:hypothetical protein OBBRIDRAFT_847636 [Obba rivulosa]
MFAMKTVVTLALLAIPAIALPQSSACDPAQIQCCDTAAPGSSDHMREVGKALKMEIDPEMMYGTGCAPTNPVNVGGGTSCSSTPMCCNCLSYIGLIGLGCLPIDIDL